MTIPYVQRVRRKDGRIDLYFRKGDARHGPLKAADDTLELKLEVDVIVARLATAQAAATPTVGTVLGALEQYNRSSDFTGLEPATKRDYQYKIDELKEDCGSVRLSDVAYPWLKALQDVWAVRGYKACNDRMQILKNAMKPHMKAGLVTGAPFSEIDKLKRPANKPEPHPAWKDHEVEAAIEMAIRINQPGLARGIALGRWGGFRLGGICAIPLHARTMGYDDDEIAHRRLFWQTSKAGVLCDKPEDPRLTALLARTPDRALTIAYNKYGQPWIEGSFDQALERLMERFRAAGVVRPNLDTHGLRHARGIELAHAGASEFEIMAHLEHTTPFTARIYIRQANRDQGANSGQAKIDSIVRLRAAKQASANSKMRAVPR